MSRQSDFLRSLVRGLAEGAGRRLAAPLQRFNEAVKRAVDQASSVPEVQITHALTHVEGVREASAACRPDGIWIDATLEDGQGLKLCLIPLEPRFAPRGAKELLFRVEPRELTAKATARDLVAAVAALIAHTLWGPFLRHKGDLVYDAIAEREGDGVRVDLRTVPAVRTAQQRGLGQVFDLVELSAIRLELGAVRLALKLPPVFAP